MLLIMAVLLVCRLGFMVILLLQLLTVTNYTNYSDVTITGSVNELCEQLKYRLQNGGVSVTCIM